MEHETRLTPSDWPVCARLAKPGSDAGSSYDGYWGDYFATAQGTDVGGAPFSVTAFSDSRPGGSCRRRDRMADPLHVAAARW